MRLGIFIQRDLPYSIQGGGAKTPGLPFFVKLLQEGINIIIHSMTIQSYRVIQSQTVIHSHKQLCIVIHSHIKLCTVTYSHTWPYIALHSHTQSYIVIHSHIQSNKVIIVIHSHAQSYIVIHIHTSKNQAILEGVGGGIIQRSHWITEEGGVKTGQKRIA